MPKTNYKGKTTVFVGLTEEKILNEIAYARLNLSASSWVPHETIGQYSNEWNGLSSTGIEINMYIGVGTNDFPIGVPSQSLNYGSAFPKR